MDPHTHDHTLLIINTSWGEGTLLESMASMDHHQHSHIFFHDQQHHVHPSSLEHHSSVWQSSPSDYNNYIIPSGHPNQIISSPPASTAANSLFIVGSNLHSGPPTNHHQLTLDHHLYSYHVHGEDEQEEEGDGIYKDLLVAVNEEDEKIDHEVDEELSAMKEMTYKIAAMQPVDIDPSTIRKPKRRNVRISDDPQTVATRHRRERISEKMRILQRLVPGGTKMHTASMLDEAIRYVKFLKRHIKHLRQDQNHPHDQLPPPTPAASLKASSLSNTSPVNHQYLRVAMANKQRQQCVRFVAAASPSTATENNCSTVNFRHNHREAENSFDMLNIFTSSKNKMHQCMDNNGAIVIQAHPQMDLFNQVTGFINQSELEESTCGIVE